MSKKTRLAKFNSVGLGARELMSFCTREPRTVIRYVGKLWPFYLRNFVPDMLINGHSGYVRFIIVGRTRTGSNFLRGSLMSHRQIIAFGDIFRKYNVIHWGIPLYPQSKSMLSSFQSDPVGFLETRVFGKFPTHISAVGFKTIYPHALNKNWEPVRTHLGNQRTLRVIHVKRKNVLKTHLSLKRVEQRKDRWANISGAEEDNTPVFLDYEDCLRAFIDTRKQEREYDALFENHDRIDVVYENLCSDYKSEMKRIQEFLGVDYETVKPLTFKQSRQPLSVSISNYFELKERFQGTPWAEFFEDQVRQGSHQTACDNIA